jgi:hypothetical protein
VVFSLASPTADPVEVSLRAELIRRVVAAAARAAAGGAARARSSSFPTGSSRRGCTRRGAVRLPGQALGALEDASIMSGARFVAIDFTPRDEEKLLALDAEFLARGRARAAAPRRVGARCGSRRSTTSRSACRPSRPTSTATASSTRPRALARDELARLPSVGRVELHGVVPERVSLFFSQERLAALGRQPAADRPGPQEPERGAAGRHVEHRAAAAARRPPRDARRRPRVLDTVVANTPDGKPVYVRDVAEVRRTYDPRSDTQLAGVARPGGDWRRTRSVAVAVQARSGVQVTQLGVALDAALGASPRPLPADLEVVHTTDQPELVHDKISEFMRSLLEAVLPSSSPSRSSSWSGAARCWWPPAFPSRWR